MSLLAMRLAGIVSNDLQVAGLDTFDEVRWKEAILFYLNAIWSGVTFVCDRPKITLGELTLRLDPTTHEYYAYGRGTEQGAPSFPKDARLMVGRQQWEVEQALIRFVRNNRIKRLTIVLEHNALVELWKKPRRSQYGISTTRVPLSCGGLSPVTSL